MVFVYEPMEMIGLKNITLETLAAGAALQKSSGTHGSWDATASSSECIEGLQSSRRGLRCELSAAPGSSYNQGFKIGLLSMEAACPQHPQQEQLRNSVDHKSINYAAYIFRGRLYVHESGNTISGVFCSVQAGDVIEIRLTREDLPKIEYCVNGTPLHTSSEGPPKQARLFAAVCALYQGPLVEDLQWILEDPATTIARLRISIAEQQTCITEQQTRVAELHTRIAEQQEQLQRLQEENSALRAASRAASNDKQELQEQMQHLREENSALRDQAVQLQEQMEEQLLAASRASTDEKQELQGQLQRLQEEISALHAASRAAMDEKQELQEQIEEQLQAASRTATNEKQELQAKVEALESVVEQQKQEMKAQLQRESDETAKLQVRAMQLQGQNDALRAAMGQLTEENAQRELREMQLQAREEQRRRLLQHSETSSEDWERVGPSFIAATM